MSDTKIKLEVHQECRKPPGDEWVGIMERSGGPAAPTDIHAINARLFKSFDCESHYVALEKTGKEKGGDDYSYVLRHHKDLTNIPPIRLDDYHPDRPGILADGFFILPRKNKKMLVVPTHAFTNFLGKERLLKFYLRLHLSDLVGGRLIRDFELNQVNGDGKLFSLDIRLADEPFEPLAIPRFSPAPPPAPVSKMASLAPIPEPISEPWENPCDTMIFEGSAGGGRKIPVPRKDNLYPVGLGKIGCRFQSPTAAIDLFGMGEGLGNNGGGGGGIGFRYPERPMITTSAGFFLNADRDGNFFPRFSVGHHLLLPSLRILGHPFLTPFATLEQDMGQNDIRVTAGFQLMLPMRSKNFLEKEWDEKRTAAILGDQILLGISAANLGANFNEMADPMIKVSQFDADDVAENVTGSAAVAAGMGLAAGQMAFLDSMLIEAAAKGKISGFLPNSLIGIKTVLGAGAFFFSPASPDDFDNPISEHFGHAMLLDAGLGLTQSLFDIRPDNSKWILANTLAGGALLIRYARDTKEREQITVMKNGEMDTEPVLKEARRNGHWTLAGAALLSYGLNLWLYTKGWNRF